MISGTDELEDSPRATISFSSSEVPVTFTDSEQPTHRDAIPNSAMINNLMLRIFVLPEVPGERKKLQIDSQLNEHYTFDTFKKAYLALLDNLD